MKKEKSIKMINGNKIKLGGNDEYKSISSIYKSAMVLKKSMNKIRHWYWWYFKATKRDKENTLNQDNIKSVLNQLKKHL